MQSITGSLSSCYETANMINQYLLFHYGNTEEQLPYSFGPQEALHFPARCVHESLKGLTFETPSRALDIGCATGRASFELARYFDHVVAVDNSKLFIETAKELQQQRNYTYQIHEEGIRYSTHTASISSEIEVERVNFVLGDATKIFSESERFDFVLAANLLCRLTDPQVFLESIFSIVKPNGIFALASPYSWLEEFTPKHKWLGSEHTSSFSSVKKILTPNFSLLRSFELPFLMREHARKYQWGVSQMSLWKRI